MVWYYVTAFLKLWNKRNKHCVNGKSRTSMMRKHRKEQRANLNCLIYFVTFPLSLSIYISFSLFLPRVLIEKKRISRSLNFGSCARGELYEYFFDQNSIVILLRNDWSHAQRNSDNIILRSLSIDSRRRHQRQFDPHRWFLCCTCSYCPLVSVSSRRGWLSGNLTRTYGCGRSRLCDPVRRIQAWGNWHPRTSWLSRQPRLPCVAQRYRRTLTPASYFCLRLGIQMHCNEKIRVHTWRLRMSG